MKIEISIEKNGKEKPEDMEEMELDDQQKMTLGDKIKKNIALSRKERKLLSQYLLKEED